MKREGKGVQGEVWVTERNGKSIKDNEKIHRKRKGRRCE